MNGQHVILKGGNVTGHSSLIVILPEKNVALYMSNNDDNPYVSIDVYEAFMNHYYPRKTEVSKPTYSAISERQAKAYAGLYKTRVWRPWDYGFLFEREISYGNSFRQAYAENDPPFIVRR